MREQLQRLSLRSKKLFKINPRDILAAIGPSALLVVLVLVVAYLFIDPAPPQRLVLSAGNEDSAYSEFAKRYRKILARDGITLEIRPSAGALDNLLKLRNDTSIDIGFVQDGLNDGAANELLSLGSIGYEPIWVFTPAKQAIRHLNELHGKRIAIGTPGAGTESFARRLLDANGVNRRNSSLLNLGRDEAAAQLKAGHIDAAFFVGTPDTPLIQALVKNPALRPVNFDQADAYTQRFPFLHHLILPHGSVDLRRNLPERDLHLLATTTTLAAQDNLHPALVALLMRALSEVHNPPGPFNKKGEFPADKDDDFRLDPDAGHYYQSGPPLLQRYLPFWVATFIDRTMIFFLPLLALLIPLTKAVPQIYSWRIKNRIYRWYGELKFLETQLREANQPEDFVTYLAKVDWIEEQVAHVTIPLSFSEHFYVLKEHIDLVQRKILRAQEIAAHTATQASQSSA